MKAFQMKTEFWIALGLHMRSLCGRLVLIALLALSSSSIGAEGLAPVRLVPREPMPIGLYGVPVGAERSFSVDVPVETRHIRKAWLDLIVDDIDETKEAILTLNDKTVIPVVGSVLGEAGHQGRLAVPVEALIAGRNTFTFTFADNLAGTTGGYIITDASLVLAVPREHAPKKQARKIVPLESERIFPAGDFPLDLRQGKPGDAVTLTFDLPDPAGVREAYLDLLAGDVDDPKEVSITLNDETPVATPRGLVGPRTGHAGRVALPTSSLRSGKNSVRLSFSSDGDGALKGFRIDDASLVLFRKKTRPGQALSDGLVLNYDFTAGSLPDEKGFVRDLSGKGGDGVVRPAKGSTQKMFSGVAAEGEEYRVAVKSGGDPARLGELQLLGRSWIDVPAGDLIRAIGNNGTVEVILRPIKGGVQEVLGFGSVSGGEYRHLGLHLLFNWRAGVDRIYCDMRADNIGAFYNRSVHKDTAPIPADLTPHQLVYQVRDGVGRFFHNGIPYEIQNTMGSSETGSLFAWIVDKGQSKANLRMSIGARLHPGGASLGFLGGLSAVRIYNRTLSTEEMRTNYRATVGADAPTPKSYRRWAEATAWQRPKVWLPREDRPVTKRTRPMLTATTIDFFDTPYTTKKPWTDDQTEALVKRVADAGFDIFYLRLGNGVAYWPSTSQDMYHKDNFTEGPTAVHVSARTMNALESFVKWCHHYNLKAFYWQTIYDDEITLRRNAPGTKEEKELGEYPMLSRFCRENPHMQWEHRDTWKDPDRGKQGYVHPGERRYWGGCLSYLYPEARAYRVNMCREYVEKYNVDGVAFSIRSHSVFGGTTWQKLIDRYGFNQPIVDEYKRLYGVDIRTQPFDRTKWAEIRGEGVTQLVREVHAYMKSAGKEFHMMANPGPGRGLDDMYYLKIGQAPMFWGKIDMDYAAWAKEGIMDTLMLHGTASEGYPSPWAAEVAHIRKILDGTGVPIIFFYRFYGGSRVPWDACRTDLAQLYNDDNLDGLNLYETDNIFPGGGPSRIYSGKLVPYLKELFTGKAPSE